MRLDLYLARNGYAQSRERARRLILSGSVSVDGVTAEKPSEEVEGTPAITVREETFVGRGGEKLEAALAAFSVDPAGLRALDIGASTSMTARIISRFKGRLLVRMARSGCCSICLPARPAC